MTLAVLLEQLGPQVAERACAGERTAVVEALSKLRLSLFQMAS